MDYREAIDRIHEFGSFGSKLGLSRMERLMALLGDPQDQVRTIHVAGTNGKGSVCRYIYSVLQEAGYKAGLYTSPYLEKFTERIEVDGNQISENDLARYTQKVLEQVDVMLAAGLESPTEFELITAIGFCYFADRNIDFLVLEVGLGGTGDSTNIVKKPEVSVITSISFDHMDYLGDTLEKIAAEKAGIIKEGVPSVVCVKDAGARAVIKAVASGKNSPFYDVSDCEVSSISMEISGSSFDVRIGGREFRQLRLTMAGRHQIQNAVCALSALELLREEKKLTLEDRMVYDGMRKARQTGRLEILRKDPYFIIDGAHNEAGAEALADTLALHFKGKRILMILGMLKDKKTDGILDSLLPLADSIVAVEPDNPRKLSAEELARLIGYKGREAVAIPSISEAVAHAKNNQKNFDVIIFAGSLYLVGKVRSILNETI